MLTKDNKIKLKSLSNSIKNRYQIGKNGLTNTTLDLLDKALLAHELIKINVLKNYPFPVQELVLDLSSNLHADVISVIGRVITLYRFSNKDGVKHIL